jgi:hypothetical protein
LLPWGRVAQPRGKERQPPVEPYQQLVRLQERNTRRRELDRQRQPVEPAADLADRRRRAETGGDRAGAFDEESRSVIGGQWFHRVPLLGFDVQRLAAGDEHHRVGRACKQQRDRRSGLDDLLEVVEEDE